MSRNVCVVLIIALCAGLTYGDNGARAAEATTQPSKDFVAEYIRAEKKGYISRPCGFDMNRNGRLGEPTDRLVGDGKTKDPDGDGVDEDILYVDAKAGSDEAGDGSAARPYKTVQKALNVADGPGDGAEDIICISGVFRERLTIKRSGVAGHYVRDNFQFPKNPTMLIGWDKDGDGKYPPYDKDDIAVLDGNVGPKQLDIAIRTDGKLSYIEIAHLTIQNYGGPYSEAGALKLFHWGTGLQSHVYVHDTELKSININAYASAIIVCSFWGGPMTDVAIINNLVDEYGSFFCRGAPPSGAGRFRFQNLTLKMLGPSGGKFVTGWKLWGQHNGVEILDNVINANAQAWNPVGNVSGVGVCQAAQDWTIRGNLFIDTGVTLQPFAKGYIQGRQLDNILVDRNIFLKTYTGWHGGPIGISVLGSNNDPNVPAEATDILEDATITNNFFTTTAGYITGIRCWTGNNMVPQKGTLTIAGNTFHGPFTYKTIWGPRRGQAILLSQPHTPFVYKQQSFVIKNNIIANTGPAKNIVTSYAPSNLIARGNIYDPDASFRWNRQSVLFSAWQKATGQDADSKTGRPAFVDAEHGDLHLAPDDTVARGFGVDITKTTKTDFDGDPRSSDRPVAGADVPGPKTTKRPLRAATKKD